MAASLRYRAVWRSPNAPTLLMVGVLARLGIGVTPLALLLLVQDITGRYALGGLTVAVYALAGVVVSPLLARLHLLRTASLIHAGTLAGLAVTRDLTALLLLAAVAGAAYPPLTGAIRGAWSASPLRTAALAAETSLFEFVYIGGPLLVAVFGSTNALLGTAVVTALGGLRIAAVTCAPVRSVRSVRARGLATLLACTGLLGAAFGLVTVAVPAFADGPAGDSSGGLLLGVWGIGSAVGGVWFGARTFAAEPSRQYATLLAANAFAFALLAAMPGLAALGVALFLGGTVIAPALTVENALVSHLVPNQARNEAYTRLITVAVACSAGGGALAGPIADRPGGVRWVFLLASGCAIAAATTAAWPGSPLSRAQRSLLVRPRSPALGRAPMPVRPRTLALGAAPSRPAIPPAPAQRGLPGVAAVPDAE